MPYTDRIAIAVVPASAAAAGIAVWLAHTQGPLVALAVTAGFILVVLTVALPMVGLLSALALVPLELVSLPLGEGGISPSEAMFACTGASWVVRCLVQGRSPFVKTTLNRPLVLILVSVLPGLATGLEPMLVLKTLVMWACFGLVFHMVAASNTPRRTVHQIGLVLTLAGAVVGIIATVESGAGETQQLTGAGDVASNRAVGAFAHPNTLATFEGLALPLALVLAIQGPRSLRPLATGAAALAFAGLAFSLSRGGLLAGAAALGVMVIWSPFRRVALLGVPLGDVRQVETVTKRLESVTYSAQGVDPRLALWRELPSMVRDNVALGVGANQFSLIAPQYGLFLSTGTYEHAHNLELTFLLELGILGFVGVVWLTVATAQVVVRAVRVTDLGSRALAFGVAAALTGFLTQAQVDYTLRSNVIVATLLSLCGCAVALSRAGWAGGSPARG
ncbi:MAG: O-antigen ligase family protein [Actinobacteria bacterium]|nr:O-antigen ligase family protein [Actinomycetota bacterium]